MELSPPPAEAQCSSLLLTRRRFFSFSKRERKEWGRKKSRYGGTGIASCRVKASRTVLIREAALLFLLAVVGVFAVLAEVVLVQQLLLHPRLLRIQLQRMEVHERPRAPCPM